MKEVKYLMQAIEKQEAILELPVIRMEIDYELMNLYEAMQAEDTVEMEKIKKRLEKLRTELNEMTVDHDE